jgi:hypothetical protein
MMFEEQLAIPSSLIVRYLRHLRSFQPFAIPRTNRSRSNQPANMLITDIHQDLECALIHCVTLKKSWL